MFVAVTGNIGVGKSTMIEALKDDYKVYNADEISKVIFNNHLDEIKALFSTTDRKIIASIIFTDYSKKLALESIIIPEIKAEILALRKIARHEDIIFEMATLFEQGFEIFFDEVILIHASNMQIIKRINERDDSNWNDVNIKLASQANYDDIKDEASYTFQTHTFKEQKEDQKDFKKLIDKIIRKKHANKRNK